MIRFKLGRPYNTNVIHNLHSYVKVCKCLNRSPKKSRTQEDIVDAIGNHPKGGGARGFFAYLLKCGWIVRAGIN